MKVIDILAQQKATLSFEVFPPKKDSNFDSVVAATEKIAALKPSFMSVTYGAGGGTSEYTLHIAKNISDKYQVTVLPHLTCISSTREHVRSMIQRYHELGFENIMALRGDIPKDGAPAHDYHYACELIRDIREIDPEICIGGACYPDGHVECAHKNEDIEHIREKVDAGCQFLTTQMFFDNSVYYNYLYRLREHGVNVPVLAGIMPITNRKQVERSVSLSGTTIPNRFRSIVDKFGDDPKAMQQAGIIYAAEQIVDLLANDCTHIHVYSMNKPEVAAGIQQALAHLI
ncbi:methylenetetrahydrofolate reductase [NAD(P)H] [Oribacterium sp. HCP28S3_H8]|uniref:methylenetetrahydrofolate reductase [NAD(P)H] n=1 Tax=Oribacterium sp. HCP28S3_H8 TaxID=3438945 RepID=UPI003F891D42